MVILFFMMSGYYLLKSFKQHQKTINPWAVTLRRVRKIYPHYIYAFTMKICFTCRDILLHPLRQSRYLSLMELMKHLPEVLLIQNNGISDGGINYPCWQTSTIVFASHILYSLLSFHESLTTDCICPCLALFSLVYLRMPHTDRWGIKYNFLPIQMFRAMGGISLGIFLYYPVNELAGWIKSCEKKYPKRTFWLSSMISGILWICLYNSPSNVPVILFVFIFAIEISQTGLFCFIFNRQFFEHFEMMSFAIVFNHAFVISIVRLFTNSISAQWRFLFANTVLIYSVATVFIIERIRDLCVRRH